ncbi:serine/threonine protein kinase, partial [Lyngbya confervoides]
MRDLLIPGTELAGGTYEIEHALGRGGFGVTYRARHKFFSRSVAIKEYFPQEHAHREGTTGRLITPASSEIPYQKWFERFKREGQILYDLNERDPHPNIVRVQNLFEERNTVYLVMELLEGKTLRDELDARGGKGLPRQRVVEIMNALVGALSKVHEQNLYHLDIKPENVMVTKAGRIVLLDFGAARQELSRTRSKSAASSVAFSESYAPPELMAAEELSSATDVFELGMLLHEMLTGQLPPSALNRFMREREWRARLETPWQEMVDSAIRMEASERPRNVKAWWGRYERWQEEKERDERSRLALDRQGVEQERVKQAQRDRERHLREDQTRQAREARESAKRPREEVDREKPVQAPSTSPTGIVWTRRNVLTALGVSFGGTMIWAAIRNQEEEIPVPQVSSGGSPALPTSPSVNLEEYSFETVQLNAQGAITDRSQGTAAYFQENGINLDMVWIPGGRFTMGSPSGELERTDAEGP